MAARVFTASVGALAASADQNEVQDRMCAARMAGAANDLSVGKGEDVFTWVYNGTLADGTKVKLDGTIDWRDRLIEVLYRELNGTTKRPGGTADYDFAQAAFGQFFDYTGTGGLDAAGVAVTDGNPPLQGATGGDDSYATAVGINATPGGVPSAPGLWLYADPGDGGALNIYNDTGSPVVCIVLKVRASGDLAKH